MFFFTVSLQGVSDQSSSAPLSRTWQAPLRPSLHCSMGQTSRLLLMCLPTKNEPVTQSAQLGYQSFVRDFAFLSPVLAPEPVHTSTWMDEGASAPRAP